MGTWKIANSRAGTPSASLSSTTIKYRQRHRRHLDMALRRPKRLCHAAAHVDRDRSTPRSRRSMHMAREPGGQLMREAVAACPTESKVSCASVHHADVAAGRPVFREFAD